LTYIQLDDNIIKLNEIWPIGQAVKTPPFHGGNMGSIPVWVTIYADVAELADALDLGSSAYGVQVQLLSSAPKKAVI
jgi:hypothetical protein